MNLMNEMIYFYLQNIKHVISFNRQRKFLLILQQTLISSLVLSCTLLIVNYMTYPVHIHVLQINITLTYRYKIVLNFRKKQRVVMHYQNLYLFNDLLCHNLHVSVFVKLTISIIVVYLLTKPVFFFFKQTLNFFEKDYIYM